MAKARSKALDYAVYACIRTVACILQAVPLDVALWLTDVVASLIFRSNRRYRDVTIDNLRNAFPGRYTEAELHVMALKVYRHFASMALELILMPRKLTAGNKHRYVDAREYRPFKEAIDSGRPVIMLTGHFGNWELGSYWLGLTGVHSHVVARPLDNPYLEQWLRSCRERTGHKMLSKTGDIRRMNEVLAAGGTLGTLGDQDAGEHGLFVPFFGRPASTHKAIARLAQRTGAVIAVFGMQKTGGLLEYTIRIMEIIRPEDYEHHADATLAITQRFTAAVEEMIRLDPAQYFWLHRRWKHQPPVAAVSKAAEALAA